MIQIKMEKNLTLIIYSEKTVKIRKKISNLRKKIVKY